MDYDVVQICLKKEDSVLLARFLQLLNCVELSGNYSTYKCMSQRYSAKNFLDEETICSGRTGT